LELSDPAFDHTVLSGCRSRLVRHGGEERLLEAMVERLEGRGWARGRARTDCTHVLAKVRALNRGEVVGETLRAALNDLASVAPAWLRAHALPDWVDRYDPPNTADRLPNKKAQQESAARKRSKKRWSSASVELERRSSARVAQQTRQPGCARE
jgi:transposase